MNKIVTIFACVCIVACAGTHSNINQQRLQDYYEQQLLSWRISLVPVDEAETFYKENSPFGKDNHRPLKEWAEWNKFISNYQPGDELWYYCSPKESWAKLAGEEGFAIYRQGKLISRIITVLN